MHAGVQLADCHGQGHYHGQEWNDLRDNQEHHGEQEVQVVPNSNIVEALVEGLEQNEGCQNDFNKAVRGELRQQLDHEQESEERKLGTVQQVPGVLEVA